MSTSATHWLLSALHWTGTDLGGPETSAALANMCVQVHRSVEAAAERFWSELRRRYYTTPKSYLDLIILYLQLLGEKRWVGDGCRCLHGGMHASTPDPRCSPHFVGGLCARRGK